MVQRRRGDCSGPPLVGAGRRGRPRRDRQRLDPPRPRSAAGPDRRLRAVRRGRRRARGLDEARVAGSPRRRRARALGTPLDRSRRERPCQQRGLLAGGRGLVLRARASIRPRPTVPSSTTATRSTSTIASSWRRSPRTAKAVAWRSSPATASGPLPRWARSAPDRAECVDAALPGGIEVGVRRKAAVELEHHHSVRECERGTGCIRVAVRGRDEGRRGAIFEARRQALAGEGPVHVGEPHAASRDVCVRAPSGRVTAVSSMPPVCPACRHAAG